jgi:hypothetical protein
MNESSDNRTWIYHQIKSPKGTIVTYSEAFKMLRKGWVDTPDKFGKGISGKWYNFIIFFLKIITTLKQFWLKYWQWIIGIVITIIFGLLNYLKSKG